MGTGDQAGTWGDTTNTNLGSLLEGAIAGLASISVTSANQALTVVDYAADQSRMAIISLSTTTAANFNVYAPPVSKTYIIANTSAYTATIYNSTVAGNTTAAGTGVTIPAGKATQVWSDGTNFYKANTAIDITADVTGTLPVGNGGTGTTTLASGQFLKGAGTSAVTTSATVALASEVSGILPVANGGTGATTFSSGQFLKGAGTSAVTTSATVALGSEVSGTLPIGNGGTGATTQANAQTNLDVPSRSGTGASGTWGISISGNAATASNGGVTSVNSQTGAVTQTSVGSIGSYVIAQYVATGTHPGSGPTLNVGDTVSGSTLRYNYTGNLAFLTGDIGGVNYVADSSSTYGGGGTSLSGTWRCMGRPGTGVGDYYYWYPGLFVRVS